MKLSIISLNFKKPELTVASMESLYNTYKKYFDQNEWEYLVVDNHSEDESPKILKKAVSHYKNFSFIQNPHNNGFGAGNNLGASHAKGEYLLFLNNDTVISGEGIKEMLSFLQSHQEAGIVGGSLDNEDGTAQVSTDSFYTLSQAVLLLLGMQRLRSVKNPQSIARVDWVKGALMMTKKTTFEKLGGFDEHIFMYTEDMELCYRAKQMGIDTYFLPTHGIVHKDQGSSSRSFAIVHIYESLLYFYKKHRPFWEYIVLKLLLQTKAILLILYGKLLKKEYFVVTYEKALSVVR